VRGVSETHKIGLVPTLLVLLILAHPGCIRDYDDFMGTKLPWATDIGGNEQRTGDLDASNVCPPDCNGKGCGSDGCGGYCGSCEPHEYCDNGQCLPKCGDGLCDEEERCACPEDCGDLCAGEECGPDGCGGTCGECGLDEYCKEGLCQPLCGDGMCDDGEDCMICPTDCDDCAEQCVPACDPSTESCAQATTGEWVCAARMAAIPAGNFWMGCNNCPGTAPEAQDVDCGSDEHPYHQVYLDAYEVDRTEVTADQYAACKLAGGCTAPGTQDSACTWQQAEKGDCPINCVKWGQADKYCHWIGKALCTEAQWEKGARGGCEQNGGASKCKAESRKYPWGNEAAECKLAVKSGCEADGPAAVCSLSPTGDSPYGLCDMSGNVWEWVADWYQEDYYCDGPEASGDQNCDECGAWWGAPEVWSNPPGPESSGSYRGKRGGSFSIGSTGTFRVSFRGGYSPSLPSGDLGFRCCRPQQ
jgi:formylglycine-generating enzyme